MNAKRRVNSLIVYAKLAFPMHDTHASAMKQIPNAKRPAPKD